MVAAGTNIITTVAGTGGSSGSSGDGGPATSALLNFPWSVTIDSSDNLYIGDFLNGAVRKVDAVTQTINTVVGILGSQGTAGTAVRQLRRKSQIQRISLLTIWVICLSRT